jgi:pimeloyl-ACP methyl ester carboxylesterase
MASQGVLGRQWFGRNERAHAKPWYGLCPWETRTVKASSTPKLDRTIELADGRTLAYSEWGDLGGRPVVFLHGTPSSRLLCWDVDATEALGVRLVTVDRSGYGRSDPRADVTLLNWVDDYIELVDHLGLPSCPVLGHSGGGPYALACAYRLPERVSSLGLAASPGLIHETPGALDGLSPEERADYDLFRRDRVAGIEAIRRRCQWYDGEGWQTLFTESWGQADDRVLARPTRKTCGRGLVRVRWVSHWTTSSTPNPTDSRSPMFDRRSTCGLGTAMPLSRRFTLTTWFRRSRERPSYPSREVAISSRSTGGEICSPR